MRNKSNSPLYLGAMAEARAAGELEQWKDSQRANIACRDAIDSAISHSFDGWSLGDGVVKYVVDRFGVNRVQFVLATNLRIMSWDGRFSRDNREWANRSPAAAAGTLQADELRLRCHPAILDGFVRMFRQEYPELQQRMEGQGM